MFEVSVGQGFPQRMACSHRAYTSIQLSEYLWIHHDPSIFLSICLQVCIHISTRNERKRYLRKLTEQFGTILTSNFADGRTFLKQLPPNRSIDRLTDISIASHTYMEITDRCTSNIQHATPTSVQEPWDMHRGDPTVAFTVSDGCTSSIALLSEQGNQARCGLGWSYGLLDGGWWLKWWWMIGKWWLNDAKWSFNDG